ncbi:4-hydroxy-tetrahydrodipicolinate synthase [Myxococcus sp. CA051A]|uniref:4-hydroxy-tetrahydrodipicolinate synthase n=1 Tax=Myxococcus llanfairpwllgwyngyllgogerychwyrndrobwllllantysiliogogogochensis TaxID=2590453 RepID=A0A540WYD4_9BACT|nr:MULTISPECIES: 4-hydroxy-tetrahydrodipicolinate synthase [Myxococcus]NTX15886.1 4-hydroxy-tetrahydrodipicolinate synthase [Myxococcus sp. CA056]NTX33925.1 4-hydroxy-tetrahydrodipicolinate synthase [Myxococcus sp. CA033]NTX58225.1 4-hydroxy-tetrahydrodipicolinate synthase [Myxococcus sp. CA039A]NTX65246.1 4-hydroxy-tetrahydrodipicolinate synthase [Myxococcus sp. CA051A]TQF14016.1 4-hydroxy-tetrahydrodipicolinate synthase [Myxococcus llanfairpwllgwyngyllgogerychwyrndrobwllllantysiliogogogochen
MKTFEGSMTALATPFRNGALDESAYRALVRQQIEGGTSVLVPMGTTGESVTMSADEQARAVRVVVEEAKGRVQVLGGAGSNNTAEVIASVGRVRDAGADGSLIVTPYYNRPTQAGLVEHFRAVARAHPGFPIVAYNVPGRTGVDLLPETVQRLCDFPEVVAIKEATGNMARAVDILEKCGDRLTLLSGDDFTVLPFIACGGKGVISVSSNVAPRLMADLVAAGRAGDFAKARELQVKMNNLHRLLFVESSPIPVKWGLHLLGLFGPEVRLPLVPMTAPNAEKLGDELRLLGLLKH